VPPAFIPLLFLTGKTISNALKKEIQPAGYQPTAAGINRRPKHIAIRISACPSQTDILLIRQILSSYEALKFQT
jgi:hypothetical protein